MVTRGSEEPLMTGGGDLHVSLAVDRHFVRPLAVALFSLGEAHAATGCQVTVLHGGLDSNVRRRLVQDVNKRLEIEWREVRPQEVAGASYSTFLTPASLYRLLLPKLLPASIERTIYLDADTATLSSLAALANLELGTSLVGAVRDAGSPWAAGPIGPDWRGLGLAPDSAYFNSGLLAIPLDRWREENPSERALSVLRVKSPTWGDQDALNVALEGRWLELPRCWNMQTADFEGRGVAWALWRQDVESAIAKPAVVHYTGRHKPWSPGSPHPLADTWFAFLDQTSWAGWRPPKPPGLAGRIAARARLEARAALVRRRSRPRAVAPRSGALQDTDPDRA